jgi:hypothetical protein
MKRGDVWTASGGNGYAGKPRPVVIVQDNSFDSTASITVSAFTTDETDAPLIRLLIEPNVHNWLAFGQPLDGGQDHDGAQVQAREAYRAARRPGYASAQSGHTRLSRTYRFATRNPYGMRYQPQGLIHHTVICHSSSAEPRNR